MDDSKTKQDVRLWQTPPAPADPVVWRPARADEVKSYVFAPISSTAASLSHSAPAPAPAIPEPAPAQAPLSLPAEPEPDLEQIGFEQGYEQGYNEAMAAAEAMMEQERERWADQWAQWTEQSAQWRQQLEAQAGEVALELAAEMAIALLEDTMLGQEAERYWRATLQSAIHKLTSAQLIIEVPPPIEALVAPQLEQLRAASLLRPQLALRADPMLAPCAFRIIAEGGILEADPASRIQRLKATLRSLNMMQIAAPPEPQPLQDPPQPQAPQQPQQHQQPQQPLQSPPQPQPQPQPQPPAAAPAPTPAPAPVQAAPQAPQPHQSLQEPQSASSSMDLAPLSLPELDDDEPAHESLEEATDPLAHLNQEQ